MPFFTDLSEAERYAQSRPFFHPLAIARAKEALSIEGTVPLALDVGCGTGQSAAALMSIADRVIGLDISRNMLANAKHDKRLRYVMARAESIPFQSDSMPVISSALAFHWFNRNEFLRESWRVLSAQGLLLLYNNGFRGIMRENSAFHNWGPEVYLKRFPTPPRDSKPLTPEQAAQSGFEFIAEDRYENDVSFTPEELVVYLTTQTNVVAAVEQGRDSLESAYRWLLDQVGSFFTRPHTTFVFGTRAWYLRKKAAR